MEGRSRGRGCDVSSGEWFRGRVLERCSISIRTLNLDWNPASSSEGGGGRHWVGSGEERVPLN